LPLDNNPLSHAGVYDGHTVLAEYLPPTMGISDVRRIFESERNVSEFKFCPPAVDGVLPKYTLSVFVDCTLPLSALKAEIAKVIGLSMDEFRIHKASEWSALPYDEIVDLNVTIRSVFYASFDHFIYVRKGTPAKPGERIVKFVFFDLNPESARFRDLVEMPVQESLRFSDLREVVAGHIQSKLGLSIPPSYLRFREADPPKVTELLTDTVVAHWASRYSSRDKKVAVQNAGQNVDNESVSSVIICVQRWHSSTWELGPQFEVTLNKQDSMAEFALMVAAASGIPVESLMAYRHWSVVLDISKMDTFDWKLLCHPNVQGDSISYYPWNLNISGELVFIRDSTEPIKALTAQERKALVGEADEFDFPTTWTFPSSQEKGLSIKSKRKEATTATQPSSNTCPLPGAAETKAEQLVDIEEPPLNFDDEEDDDDESFEMLSSQPPNGTSSAPIAHRSSNDTAAGTVEQDFDEIHWTEVENLEAGNAQANRSTASS